MYIDYRLPVITVISVITCVVEALAEAGGHDRSRRLALSGAREGVEHTGYLDPVGDKEELNVTRYTVYWCDQMAIPGRHEVVNVVRLLARDGGHLHLHGTSSVRLGSTYMQS